MALNENKAALNSSVQTMAEKDALIAELEQRLKAQEKDINDQVDKFEDEYYVRLHHHEKVKALVSFKKLNNDSHFHLLTPILHLDLKVLFIFHHQLFS